VPIFTSRGVSPDHGLAAQIAAIVKCFFCPRCGSRIWHESDPPVDTVTVKAGSLDQSVDASDAIHIWTSRALTGIVIPAAAMNFPEEPL
jgi:hypothetical protein